MTTLISFFDLHSVFTLVNIVFVFIIYLLFYILTCKVFSHFANISVYIVLFYDYSIYFLSPLFIVIFPHTLFLLVF